jgi:hypothetical protein
MEMQYCHSHMHVNGVVIYGMRRQCNIITKIWNLPNYTTVRYKLQIISKMIKTSIVLVNKKKEPKSMKLYLQQNLKSFRFKITEFIEIPKDNLYYKLIMYN